MKMNLVSIYLKGASFRVFGSPLDGTVENKKACKPSIEVELKAAAKKISEKSYEVVLHAKIIAEQNRQPSFEIKVKQAGIFEFNRLDDDSILPAIYAHCPDVLLPFVRQVVADLASKGGFPQLLLGPVNFEEILLDDNLRGVKNSRLAH